MAWSIFSDGGGDNAASTWAQSLAAAIGADSPAAVRFIYDWEKSEGGGGRYNPLNQGPVPGKPELTTTGQQYGGGAADYASPAAGLQGAVDYLNMPSYAGVLAGLRAGDYGAAEQALIQSPWAGGHYGWGSAWSTAPLPASSGLPGALITPSDGPVTVGPPGVQLLSADPREFTSGLVHLFELAAGVALVVLGVVMVVHDMTDARPLRALRRNATRAAAIGAL